MTYPCGKIYTDVEQGTEAWHLIRTGKITASKIADVMAKVKTGEAAAVKNYRATIVCERLTGTREEFYCNAAMQRGTELEPLARECYEFVTGIEVEQVAFVDHPYIDLAGMSPDGLCGDSGMVEIKCPNTATHIEYLLGGKPPSQYIPQMMWQMACSGRLWCDFVSYDNRLPEELQLFICRLDRDNAMIAEMEKAVFEFQSSITKMISDLKALRP